MARLVFKAIEIAIVFASTCVQAAPALRRDELADVDTKAIKAIPKMFECLPGAQVLNPQSLYARRAEVTFTDIKSLSVSSTAAVDIAYARCLLELSSTLEYLKTPPTGWLHDPVDLLAMADDIEKRVLAGQYSSQYDIEVDLLRLGLAAKDGHLSLAYSSSLKWGFYRTAPSLTAMSLDGKSQPLLYTQDDAELDGQDLRSRHITHIDGVDASRFLLKESQLSHAHDADAAWNHVIQSHWKQPLLFPGSHTNLTFANGTTRRYINMGDLDYTSAIPPSIRPGHRLEQTFEFEYGRVSGFFLSNASYNDTAVLNVDDFLCHKALDKCTYF